MRKDWELRYQVGGEQFFFNLAKKIKIRSGLVRTIGDALTTYNYPNNKATRPVFHSTRRLNTKASLGKKIMFPVFFYEISIWGAFAHLDQHGLASPNGPGVGRPAPTAATQLVCAPVPIQPGPGELVFVTQYSAGLKRQPPPTAIPQVSWGSIARP